MPLYDPCLHLILFQPEIPPNAGNVGRTCVAIGAKLWLVRPLGFQLDDYYLRRAGLDYWPHLEWEVVDDWSDLRQKLPTDRIWAFSKHATQTYTSVSYQQGDALLFGCESSGLPATIMEELRERLLLLPMRREVRSLNVANTAAVVAYEALRQGVIAPPSNVP